MNRIDKAADWLIFGVLMLIVFTLGTVCAMFTFGDFVMSSDNTLFWILLHFVAVGWLLWFTGRKIYPMIILPPHDVVLPQIAGRFVGALRGVLFFAIVGVLALAIMVFADPYWLFTEKARQIGLVWLAGGIVAGIICYPLQVARKTRLWLLVALAGEYFMFQGLVAFLQMRSLKFDYRVNGIVDKNSFPLLDATSIKRCLPDNAYDIHIHGYRGMMARFIWECKAELKDVQDFAARNQYKLEKAGKFLYFRNQTMLIWYDEAGKQLRGLFSKSGLDDKRTANSNSDNLQKK